MKSMGSCVLLALLSMAAHGGIADALGAPGAQPPLSPVSPSSAANPPAPDIPAAENEPAAPAGDPRYPNSTPTPAPASTNHYAVMAPW